MDFKKKIEKKKSKKKTKKNFQSLSTLNNTKKNVK